MRRTLRLCCTAALTLQVACGGSGGAVEAARFHYAKGNLEQAEAKLAGVVSADAAALSIRIRARRADRDALARRIAQLSAMDPRLALEGLEDLLFDSEDPIAREWVELAQSEAYDRRAEGGRVHRTIHPTGYRPDELVENEIAGEPPLVARHDRFDDPERRGAAPRTAAQSAAPRPERVAGAPPIRGEPMADPGPADPEGAPAREAARSIDLLVAAERWMEQGLASPAGEEREACIARARGLERRHRLREEIVSARSSDPVRFADCCDIAAAGPSGLIVGEEFTTWEALPTETLETAARLVELSAEAECGLLDELLLHAHGARRTELLAELPRWITRGVLSEEGAWEIVARERGETLPEGGYVFDDGGWVERGEHEAALKESE